MSDKHPVDTKIIDENQWFIPTDKKEAEESQTAAELAKRGKKPSMEVKVASPFTNYFNGPAFSISGVNATGPFDILPFHHNFISLLERCTLIIRTTTGEEQKINIGGGLLHVKADKVNVFLDV